MIKLKNILNCIIAIVALFNVLGLCISVFAADGNMEVEQAQPRGRGQNAGVQPQQEQVMTEEQKQAAQQGANRAKKRLKLKKDTTTPPKK
jgi:outer membrane murein-binding lipoprotein Lpp